MSNSSPQTPSVDSPVAGSAPPESTSNASQDAPPSRAEPSKGAATEPPAASGDQRGTGATGAVTSPSGEEPQQPRRPPTLYAPGESHENGSKKEPQRKNKPAQ